MFNRYGGHPIEEYDKLIEIITTMLDITETEDGVSRGQSEKVNLIPLILGVCELFDPVAEDKGVQLITFLPDTMHVQGDKSRLQRLVTNLLENAIKYNRHGGTLTISLNMENHYINIQVQDTGAGIAADELSRLTGATGAAPKAGLLWALVWPMRLPILQAEIFRLKVLLIRAVCLMFS